MMPSDIRSSSFPERLVERVRDPEEKVRFAAVAVVCGLASENPGLVKKELILEVGVRIRDKRVSVAYLCCSSADSSAAYSEGSCYSALRVVQNPGS